MFFERAFIAFKVRIFQNTVYQKKRRGTDSDAGAFLTKYFSQPLHHKSFWIAARKMLSNQLVHLSAFWNIEQQGEKEAMRRIVYVRA